MTDAVIFSKAECAYCEKAKTILSDMGYTYEEKRYPDQVTKDDVYAVMPVSAKANRLLFPQIVFRGQFVGGCDDLEDYFWEMYDDRSDDYMHGDK